MLPPVEIAPLILKLRPKSASLPTCKLEPIDPDIIASRFLSTRVSDPIREELSKLTEDATTSFAATDNPLPALTTERTDIDDPAVTEPVTEILEYEFATIRSFTDSDPLTCAD
jgi:hypothetical protein